MSSNGRLSADELSPIPGGQLRKDAAAAWNAPGGPADAGLRPTGSQSSYRDFAGQEFFWNLYQRGEGNLAAYPGTSNHGLGIAVDLAETWMRDWLDSHGKKYGWEKTGDAPNEWWHVCYVGGISFPTFKPLKHGSKGLRVVKYTKRLAFIRRRTGKVYLHKWSWKFTLIVRDAVKDFQYDNRLTADGVIGPKTAARINGIFARQWRRRGK